MKAFIMCGLPGSGKSTIARRLAEHHGALIVSKDDIRTMLHGGRYVFDPAKEPLVKNLAKLCMITLLEAGHNVILDETNLTREKRAKWIEFMTVHTSASNDQSPKIFICHCAEDKMNLDNRMQEPRGMTEAEWIEVIERHRKAFEPPTREELPTNGTLITITPTVDGNNRYKFEAASIDDLGATAFHLIERRPA